MRALRLANAVLLGLLFVLAAEGRAGADRARRLAPPGFIPVLSAPAVELYRRDNPGGSPDYVQVVDLSRGASVKLLHGPIAGEGKGQGAYGGDDPSFLRMTLEEAWEAFSSLNPNAFCITNGQFFADYDDPTNLAFPLKAEGAFISDGYAIDEFPDRKLMLEIWRGRAEISPLSGTRLYASSAPDILAGLTDTAGRRTTRFTGRTFLGLADGDGDRQFETLLIFNSKTATQLHVAAVLRGFGARKLMMLDGGESTQLLCRGRTYVSSARAVPQFVAVAGGAEAPPAATFWQVRRLRLKAWWNGKLKDLKARFHALERSSRQQLEAWWMRLRAGFEQFLDQGLGSKESGQPADRKTGRRTAGWMPGRNLPAAWDASEGPLKRASPVLRGSGGSRPFQAHRARPEFQSRPEGIRVGPGRW